MSLFELCDDILELIEVELRPRLEYNQVVREYKDPRFHKSANRITKEVERRGRCRCQQSIAVEGRADRSSAVERQPGAVERNRSTDTRV